ncbi:peptidase M1-like protein [Arcticibacter tournemirensis]|uniref:M1 family metallopeptidase n=1 Tax=Arcticibacter tournemirensis TaxID=699437 RepID=A0A4Q0MHF7_9SPHI|nr:M1 family metallopeptidase [Arcticibacter tournemirensis]KAA8477487.1 M1 family metallopeptidase [Arcticibacter tournemirensis]RXF72426.1 M1 family peptidase [Arcticibacter tournemirensis]TQM51312.1 peptidase M1-like protein [Arcticibacter tournemirensis]
MSLRTGMFIIAGLLTGISSQAQWSKPKGFTHADTLRGSITSERAWWDVQHYAIAVKPDYLAKTTRGENIITYKVTRAQHPKTLQLDLQQPLNIDSIRLDSREWLKFEREGNVWHVKLTQSQEINSTHRLRVYFSGKPQESVRPPWSGGWTFARDSLNRPWMTVTCQGLGASIWYPCKDHQSDEPDKGASLTMTVPDTLVAVANGRLESQTKNADGTATYKWTVVNPINNYNIIPYIGKYVHFDGSYAGEKGKLDLNYWVLDYNLAKAKAYMPGEVERMFKAFEHWFGPYPFYEDGYKLVDVPHTGMEHQSAVAYGNWYKPGYRQRDASGTGLGLKWDFIIVHESGHEWFGNNITSKDLADMWIHESFTNYSETLYVDYHFGKDAGNAYNTGIRTGIKNDTPIIPAYNVNAQGSGDMYPKGGNMLQTIRHSIDNDELFRSILRGLNTTFYHQTVTADQIVRFVSGKAGFDYQQVFKQYLTTTQVPSLVLNFNKDRSQVTYRWTNCIRGFNLPLVLKEGDKKLKIYPTTQPKTLKLSKSNVALLDKGEIVKMYYVAVEGK